MSEMKEPTGLEWKPSKTAPACVDTGKVAIYTTHVSNARTLCDIHNEAVRSLTPRYEAAEAQVERLREGGRRLVSTVKTNDSVTDKTDDAGVWFEAEEMLAEQAMAFDALLNPPA